jgi:hypothetical protein
MRIKLLFAVVVGIGIMPTLAQAQGRDVPVPSSCTLQVNAKLQQMIREHPRGYIENVMACGIASGTRVNHGGTHGSHHILSVKVVLPDDGTVSIQVAVNDSMDGVVFARPGDSVFAYGQGYIAHGAWAAGIHDVHCATHRSADNGWVVVNGTKTPSSCPARSKYSGNGSGGFPVVRHSDVRLTVYGSYPLGPDSGWVSGGVAGFFSSSKPACPLRRTCAARRARRAPGS